MDEIKTTIESWGFTIKGYGKSLDYEIFNAKAVDNWNKALDEYRKVLDAWDQMLKQAEKEVSNYKKDPGKELSNLIKRVEVVKSNHPEKPLELRPVAYLSLIGAYTTTNRFDPEDKKKKKIIEKIPEYLLIPSEKFDFAKRPDVHNRFFFAIETKEAGILVFCCLDKDKFELWQGYRKVLTTIPEVMNMDQFKTILVNFSS